MTASLFSQPPVAYFQPLESPPNTCTPSFISGEAANCKGFGGLTEFKTISSKVCGWAGELGKDHDLRQRAEHCAWLFSEQVAPFQFSSELPSSALISTAQQQARVDFLSSAEAMKSIFRAACDVETDVGVMIHRLGDWLVIDDGSELSGCPGGQTSADRPRNGANEGLSVDPEHQWRAEQHHCAAVTRAALAEAKSVEAQERVDKARALLWEAEIAAKRAQEELQEALAEVSRAAEARDRLAAAATSQGGPSRRSTQNSVNCKAGASSAGGSFESQDEPTGEDLQLYCNFLGHSIRLLQDEPSPSPTSSEPKVCGENGELVPLEGPPEPFRQVGVWKIADDASVVVGSRMLCLGNSEHPKLTLYLHDDNVISDMMLLEHWVECLMAGVPEFAICFHRDGAVQSYSLYQVSELRHFLEDRMQIGRRLQMTLEVLRWIKRQCRLEGCSYWLSKGKSDGALKIIMLSGPSTAKETGRQGEAPLQVCGVPAVVPPRGLVLKNTFLDVQEEEEQEGAIERAVSCPARFLTDGQTPKDEELLLSQPLRGRVSALFFRRAVSSVPGPDAARFFRHALDLEALTLANKVGPEDDNDGSPPSSPTGNTGGRVPLQACSHLGLALCELLGESLAQRSRECKSPADGMSGASASALTALLTTLQADVEPGQVALRGKRTIQEASFESRYRLLPIWGAAGTCVRTSHGAPLLFVGVPPRRRGFHAQATVAATDPEASSSNHDQLLTSILAALSRVGDAVSLLGSSGEAGSFLEEDKKRLEALAWPTAALALLRLASTLLAGSDSLPLQRLQAGAWRALCAGRRFAALDALQQPRPEPQPLFVSLPSSEELVVRLEHLSGRALLRFAGSACDGSPEDKTTAVEAQMLIDEVERKLARLEHWLTIHDGPQGETIGPAAAQEALVPSYCRLRGAWHLEQSVRLLPHGLVEAARDKHTHELLHQLMLSVSAALSEAVAGSLDASGPHEGGSWSSSLEALQAAHDQLCRGEDLATAVGHRAAAALAQASRGHLCSLAADVLVGRVLDSQSSGHDGDNVQLSAEELSVLYRICEEDDTSENEGDEASKDGERDGDALTLIGRLGDRAVATAMTALQSIDCIVEPGAVTSLSLMASGALQSAASRLQALPPPGLPVAECRRATFDMLTQALQVLPASIGSSSTAASNMPRHLAQQAACLAAQANLTQCELYANICVGSSDKPQQRQQHIQWHLDKACAALHCAVTQEEHGVSPMTSSVLAHAHLLRSQLLGTGRVVSKRPQEQSVQEVMAGCRILVNAPAQAALPDDVRAKAQELLLEQARIALRALCAGVKEKPASDVCWKELYRISLKLEPSGLEQLLVAYSEHFGSGE
eukprot:TRINITY_DN103536_c0_g1_i1.p1 TRINITY_DN103536_c0_g1~~TRINITY_DN103536_c0_g1_i1.p1  ORF type:complete len:1352 (+),score=272.85 TRINITY_DN103536_c0_g1_i1:33-4088(+)